MFLKTNKFVQKVVKAKRPPPPPQKKQGKNGDSAKFEILICPENYDGFGDFGAPNTSDNKIPEDH